MFIASIAPLAPPSSVSISGSSRIISTKRLSLTCSASGTVNNYKWYLNNNKLITSTISYSKSPAQLSDGGSYQCEACNWAGCSTRSSSYTVTVIGWFIVYHVVSSMVEPLPVHQCVHAVCIIWSVGYRVLLGNTMHLLAYGGLAWIIALVSLFSNIDLLL